MIDPAQLLISIAITAAVYLCVPVVLKLVVFRKKHYSQKFYRKVAIINAVAVMILFYIYRRVIDYPENGFNYVVAFLWGCVSYAIMRIGDRDNKESEEAASTEGREALTSAEENGEQKAATTENNKAEELVAWDELFEDGALNKVKQQTPADNADDLGEKTAAGASVAMEAQKGSAIDVKEDLKHKSVIDNPPQDNRPYKKIAIMLGIVCIALVGIMVYMSVSHNNEMEGKREQINKLTKQEAVLLDDNNSLYGYKQEVIDFYLNNAVLVTEDSKYYHRAECPKLGEEYTYWIYNSEAARADGYKKCPFCFKIDKEKYVEKYFPDYFDSLFGN